MLPVLEGLSTIGVVVAVGYVLARIRLLPDATAEVLARLVFFVATPALLLQTLAAAPITAVLSKGLAVTALATAAAEDCSSCSPGGGGTGRRGRP